MEGYERRHYQRFDHLYCTAKMSSDGKKWQDAHLVDLSASGLRIRSTEPYKAGDVLWFDLVIQGFLSEFEVKVQGTVRWSAREEGHCICGVAFQGLSHDMKIRIDEAIRMDRPVARDTYHSD